MITNFKIYENQNVETTFIINDVIDYFNAEEELIKEFLFEIIKFHNLVKFHCEVCEDYDINGVRNNMHYNKIHKGIICGYGYGFSDIGLHLTLHLKRIKYSHEININLPFTIYGELPNDIKKVIGEMNMRRDANKYNL